MSCRTPVFLSEEDAFLAARKGVLIEITGRKGHSLTNGHVAEMALKTGAKMVVNADAHGDFLPWKWPDWSPLALG